MKNTILILVLFITGLSSVTSQNLNTYKYVVVPSKFDFLKEQNQYQLNDLTKFLFEKNNFQVIFEGAEMPQELAADNCVALYTSVQEERKIFNTALKVVLKDCTNKVIFETQVGSSRKKDYKTAYHEALREAFKSIESLNYLYEPNFKSKMSVSDDEQKKELIKNSEDVIEKVKQVEEVIVSAIPLKLNVGEKSSSEGLNKIESSFNSEGNQFHLEKADFGFYLNKNKDSEAFAKLINTSSKHHYIYKNVKSYGLAYFDEQGNLIVEILGDDNNATTLLKYSKN